MKPKDLFETVRVPEPPSTLRERILAQARDSFASEVSISWSDRLWESRAARYLWVAGMITSLAAIIFWNPPLPGSKSVEHAEQITNGDRIEMQSLGIHPPLAVQFKMAKVLRSLEGEDL